MSMKSMCINRIKECVRLVEMSKDREEALKLLKEFKEGAERINEEVEDEPSR